jgi:hypothetical protein
MCLFFRDRGLEYDIEVNVSWLIDGATGTERGRVRATLKARSETTKTILAHCTALEAYGLGYGCL